MMILDRKLYLFGGFKSSFNPYPHISRCRLIFRKYHEQKTFFINIFFEKKHEKCEAAEIQALYQARVIRYFSAENIVYGFTV